MFELLKLKRLIKKYSAVFDNIIRDYEIDTSTNDKLTFKNKYGNTLEISLAEENSPTSKIIVKENTQTLSKKFVIDIPKKNIDLIRERETIIEERKHGTIVEVINKTYEITEYSTKNRYVTSLIATRYVLEEMNNIIDLEDEELVRNIAVYKSSFVSLLFSYSLYENVTEANNIIQSDKKSLSNIYASVKGPEQAEIVYDLYNGIINGKTKAELLKIKEGKSSPELYDYKSKVGITEVEDELVGKREFDPEYADSVKEFFEIYTFYPNTVDPYSRESILRALKYKPTAPEVAKQFFKRATGLPYEEFEELDFDEQQELINAVRQKKKIYSLLKKEEIPKEKVKSIFRRND